MTLIEQAVAGVQYESAPAPDAELLAAVTRIAALIGQDWPRASRQEWIDLVAIELCDMPHLLVLDALARARRFVTTGRQVVAWVAADVMPKAARLQVERDKLERLAAIATA